LARLPRLRDGELGLEHAPLIALAAAPQRFDEAMKGPRRVGVLRAPLHACGEARSSR